MIRIERMMSIENEHLYGPGKRAVIFLRGCSIHCNGCINKHLWPFSGGILVTAQEILDFCVKENVVGITIHGGEPLDQADELIELVSECGKQKLNIVLFTGYLKKELNGNQIKIWDRADLVVSGRFEENKKNINLQFRGSTNQRVYKHKGPYKNYKLTDGYTTAIITLDNYGKMCVNGFHSQDIEKLVEL